MPLIKCTKGRFLQVRTRHGKKGEKSLVITLEQTFDVIEHERGHSNSKLGQGFGMPESMAHIIIT